MRRLSQTEQALRTMDYLPTVEAKLEYQRSLPKGIGARVFRRILERARAYESQMKVHEGVMAHLRRMAEREKKPYDAWDRSIYSGYPVF
jgi:hypothetical protein